MQCHAWYKYTQLHFKLFVIQIGAIFGWKLKWFSTSTTMLLKYGTAELEVDSSWCAMCFLRAVRYRKFFGNSMHVIISITGSSQHILTLFRTTKSIKSQLLAPFVYILPNVNVNTETGSSYDSGCRAVPSVKGGEYSSLAKAPALLFNSSTQKLKKNIKIR